MSGKFNVPGVLSPAENSGTLNVRLGESQSSTGRFGVEKTLVPAGIRAPYLSARSLVTTPTELSRHLT